MTDRPGPFLKCDCDMYYNAADEAGWAWRKRTWNSYHKWRAPEPATWDTLQGEITARSVARIESALERDTPLNLIINSSGGDPAAAFALYAALRAHPAPLRRWRERSAIARRSLSSSAAIPELPRATRVSCCTAQRPIRLVDRVHNRCVRARQFSPTWIDRSKC
jgi:hypothetical protein